uniref:Uncharacterized protein n=1 Tax=Sebdenia flabellata TaxID=42024 RepID=A0A1C9CA29_9FLOR|nr:hypothetical protein Sebd_147 [Sebdenia flabellata]AOM65234.1 hypothetical protein Sebd_147 [Sebdenia flabellata]
MYQTRLSTVHEKAENLFKIRSNNYYRHPNNRYICKFEDSINTIYTLQYLLNNSFIQNIILTILDNDSKNIKSKLNTQYIRRFKYIYMKTQNYYNTISTGTNLHIKELAIINLYVMSKIQAQTGIYWLVKYLYL